MLLQQLSAKWFNLVQIILVGYLSVNVSIVLAEPLLKFHQISHKDGLVSDSVFTTVVDKKGFVWFGTEGGLQRFDGNDFRLFTTSSDNQKQGSSIQHPTIRNIVVDEDNNLWIGTEKGLDFYDSKLEFIESIDLSSITDKSNDLSSKYLHVRALYKSSDSILWVGSYHGLTKFNVKSGNVEHFSFPTIRSIAKIDNQKLLLGTLNKGLYIFDIQSNQLNQIPITDIAKANSIEALKTSKNSEFLDDISIIGITKLNSDNFLISTWGKGLLKLTLSKTKIESVILPNNELFVRQVKNSSNGSLWVSTRDNLYKTDRNFSKILDVTFNNENALDKADRFRGITIDKNRVWASSFGHGVFIHDENSEQFEFFRLDDPHKKKNDNAHTNDIWSLNGQESNIIRILTGANEVWSFNTNDHTQSKLIESPKNSTNLKFKYAPLAPNGDTLLLESYTGRFYRHSKARSTLPTTFSNDQQIKLRFSMYTADGAPYFYAVERSTNLVYLFALNTSGNFSQVASSDIKVEPGNRFANSLVLSDDTLLLGIKDRPLMKVKISNGRIEVLERADFIVNESMTIPLLDKDKNLLIITGNNGIYSFGGTTINSIKPKKIFQIGGTMSAIMNIEDNSIWSAGSNGLRKVDLNRNEMYLFDEFDGLQSHDFNEGAYLAHSGFFYFAGGGGLNRFRPSKVKPQLTPLKVNLTQFQVNGHDVTPTKNSFLQQAIVLTDSLNLSFQQNNFGIEFSTVTLPGEQARLLYSYILEGYEKEWHNVDYKKRFANYTNIPHGDYKFRVKVKNKNGIWSEQDRTLSITITPPWWLTPYAYFVYFVLFILSLNLVVRFRTISLTRRSLKLEKEVKIRTKEVEQLLEHQNQEFTNISHEFRTPLTLILGPITQVLKKLNPNSQKKEIAQLETTQRNSYRLLRMVDQLLNLESFQVKSIVQKRTVAFGETTRLIVEGFKELAKEKQYGFDIENIANVNFEFTPDAYEKILLNLLSNAFKYTPAGGTIKLRTDVSKENTFILTVSDTGIGIPIEDQATIFERFNRSSNINQENAPGAGIGLSLVKNLVELHQGSISLTSQPQQGSTFVIELPIVNPVDDSEVHEHLDESLIDIELMSLAAQVSSLSDTHTNSESSSQQNTILVIEDNDDMKQFIQESISPNYHIITASDGEQGLKIATQEIPDLIISDIMMPKLDGYQVTNELRKQTTTSHIPIILLTAKDDRVSRLKGWHEKADEYLTKPFDIDELNIRIKSLLDIRDLLKGSFSQTVFQITTDSPKKDSNHQLEFVNSLNLLLSECYSDSEIKIQQIAMKIAMSERQLSRKLKSVVNMTPAEYLRKYRLEKAKGLLAGKLSITQVAHEVGFTSSSYFTSCFKAYVGCKPSEYDKK